MHLFRNLKDEVECLSSMIRLVSLFVLLILGSTTMVHGLSVHFLHREINSWFHVKVGRAINYSLKLSRSAFVIRMLTLLRQTRLRVGTLSQLPDKDINLNLRELARLSGTIEPSIWTMDRQLITFNIENPTITVPNEPNDAIFSQLKQQDDYIVPDPTADDVSQLQATVILSHKSSLRKNRFLNVLSPVYKHLRSFGKIVQNSYTNHKEINCLRKTLVISSTLTLGLIVLLTVSATISFAIRISRLIVWLLQELSPGTQAVAFGNCNQRFTTVEYDKIGFLVCSSNQTTRWLTQARRDNQCSHLFLERLTNYLTIVLASLSCEVITLDNNIFSRIVHYTSSKSLDLN